jgi:hypothetical protein
MAKPAKFRVGRVDSNDIGRRVTKLPSISSHEFSSHERSGTVKFAVSGSGKKGWCLVTSFRFDRAHTPDAVEERKSFVRMFSARKACYKCGNGVSAPFYIIIVQANAV